MIKRIDINNFQSHKHSEIELSEGVNAFVGPSDSGKTVVMRAIRWLLENRPLGDEFRSHWGGDTGVSIKLEDDTFILRQKSKTLNRYVVDDEEFKAMGSSVPEEIAKTLNLSPINIQNQLDPPFLLSMSPGEVASTLNKIVKLDDIDTAQANIASEMRRINRDLDYQEGHEKDISAELEKYTYLDDMESLLNELDALEAQRTSHISDMTCIRGLCMDVRAFQEAIEMFAGILANETTYLELSNLFEDARGRTGFLNSMIETIDQIEEINKKMTSLGWVHKAEGVYDGFMAQNIALQSLRDEYESLYPLIEHISDLASETANIEGKIAEMQTEFNRKMPDICPLCDQPIKKTMRRAT